MGGPHQNKKGRLKMENPKPNLTKQLRVSNQVQMWHRLAILYLGGKCLVCSGTEKLQIHHIDCDWTNGDEYNLALLCKKCHTSVHLTLNEKVIDDEELISVRKTQQKVNIDKLYSSIPFATLGRPTGGDRPEALRDYWKKTQRSCRKTKQEKKQ
jgi:hypothetical protein